jgi:hypothetical protein
LEENDNKEIKKERKEKARSDGNLLEKDDDTEISLECGLERDTSRGAYRPVL